MPKSPAPIDLRSDTVTRPSAEMRKVISEAEVGDAVLGDDPTVDALERYAADLLGKESSLFFPSGIMANQVAILLQAPPGTEVVIDSLGHILNYEEAAAAAVAGVQLRSTVTRNGLLTPADLVAAIRPASRYLPRTSLVCLENTHNSAGGRVLAIQQMREIASVTREAGLALHLDGARLPNAAAAAGAPMAEWASQADTVMISLSKGLGAPVGSMLAGSAEAMAEGWRLRRRLGGGMRQAGILAAAGMFALENNLGRLTDDHRRAAMLAAGAEQIPAVSAPAPETNIVMFDLLDEELDVAEILRSLENSGVWMTQFGPRRLRAVTHLDVDDAGIEKALEALRLATDGRGRVV
ncbi:GntG family PLP-dependent aldolase [soil metagenome]